MRKVSLQTVVGPPHAKSTIAVPWFGGRGTVRWMCPTILQAARVYNTHKAVPDQLLCVSVGWPVHK